LQGGSFSKLDSEKTSQYIFVLSVVFFAAFLAEVAGVEHIIGAFVAGLVLNKLIPHHSTLMNRIDFIGNSLFIPFFLIFVGMVVDYRAFFQGSWPLIIAGILTSFAIFSKWLAALVTQLIFKLSKNERQMIFGLSTAHAAATLAIIMVGYNDGDGILSLNIVNGNRFTHSLHEHDLLFCLQKIPVNASYSTYPKIATSKTTKCACATNT